MWVHAGQGARHMPHCAAMQLRDSQAEEGSKSAAHVTVELRFSRRAHTRSSAIISSSAGSWEMLRYGWDGHIGVFAGAEADTRRPFPQQLSKWTRLSSRLRHECLPMSHVRMTPCMRAGAASCSAACQATKQLAQLWHCMLLAIQMSFETD